MAKLSIVQGTTSKLLDIFIQDSSSSTGAGLTGLAYNTASLTAYYYLEGAASSTSISLATMTLGTWASGGLIAIDGTNMPGCYQLGIPNAALTGAKSVLVYLKGATNMAPLVLEIELTANNNQDSIAGGMSALPQTACTTNASLITSGTGTDQISNAGGRAKGDVSYWNGTVVATPATAGIPDINVKNMNNVAATAITTIKAVQGLTTADTVTTATNVTTVNGLAANVITASSINAAALDGKGDWLLSSDYTVPPTAVQNRQEMDANSTGLAAIYNRIGIGGAGLTALGDARIANLDATVSSRSVYSGGAVASVTGAVGSVTAGVTVTTNNDKTGYSLSVSPPTAAQVATSVWQDVTAEDFATANSIGNSLYNAFTAGTSVYTVEALANAPSGTGASATAIATAVWTDLLASSDFSTASSVGALLKTNIDAPISSRSTFSGASVVSANVVKVNGITVNGSGTQANPWGP